MCFAIDEMILLEFPLQTGHELLFTSFIFYPALPPVPEFFRIFNACLTAAAAELDGLNGLSLCHLLSLPTEHGIRRHSGGNVISVGMTNLELVRVLVLPVIRAGSTPSNQYFL